MRERSIGVGIVGCGTAAEKIHLPALRRHNGKYRIVACGDVLTERADNFARDVGATAYHSAEELLGDDRVKLVLVLTKPPSTHRDIALAALGRGRHVVVEKPMAADMEGYTKKD